MAQQDTYEVSTTPQVAQSVDAALRDARALARGLVPPSTAQYSNPTAQATYEHFGVNTPFYHRDPYATANAFVTVNPDGSYTRSELLGFPSRYPVVLSTTPIMPGELLSAMGAYLPAGRVYGLLPAPPKPGPEGTKKEEPKKEEATPEEQKARAPKVDYAIPDIMGETVGARTVTRTPRGSETAQRTYGGGAVSDGANAALESLGDMFDYTLDTGRRPVLQGSIQLDEQHRYAPTGRAPQGTLQAAIQHAQSKGVDRSGLINQMEMRVPQIAARARARAQAEGIDPAQAYQLEYADVYRQQTGRGY